MAGVTPESGNSLARHSVVGIDAVSAICAGNLRQLGGDERSAGHAGTRMFVRNGDVDIARETAKYVHSLRRRGVS